MTCSTCSRPALFRPVAMICDRRTHLPSCEVAISRVVCDPCRHALDVQAPAYDAAVGIAVERATGERPTAIAFRWEVLP